jgi:hypothetical protein
MFIVSTLKLCPKFRKKNLFYRKLRSKVVEGAIKARRKNVETSVPLTL